MMDYERKELPAPYIKQRSRRKNGVGRLAFLILTVLCVAGLCTVYMGRNDGRFAFLFRGKADKTTENTTSAATTESTIGTAQRTTGQRLQTFPPRRRASAMKTRADTNLTAVLPLRFRK